MKDHIKKNPEEVRSLFIESFNSNVSEFKTIVSDVYEPDFSLFWNISIKDLKETFENVHYHIFEILDQYDNKDIKWDLSVYTLFHYFIWYYGKVVYDIENPSFQGWLFWKWYIFIETDKEFTNLLPFNDVVEYTTEEPPFFMIKLI